MPTSAAPALDPARFAEDLRGWARELGFADAAVSTRELDDDLAHLRRWLADGWQGEMRWLGEHLELRADPARLAPGTVTVISARLDYQPDAEAADAVLADGTRAYISRYALGRDYHRVMRGRLKKLGAKLAEAIAPHGYRVLADSAPALEKAMARDARLGWIGKNTLLLNRSGGSWFFLGELYTDLPLPAPDTAPVANLCGSCTACLTACPTQAIVAPYRLDARRCISYLTIEYDGVIPEPLRPAIGNRIFGCDDCQLACPWNRYARIGIEPDFAPRHGLDAATLVELFAWDEATWLAKTEGMPLRRLNFARWIRNLAVALGNAPSSASVIEALEARAAFPDSTAALHIRWALDRHRAATGSRSPSPKSG